MSRKSNSVLSKASRSVRNIKDHDSENDPLEQSYKSISSKESAVFMSKSSRQLEKVQDKSPYENNNHLPPITFSNLAI